MADRIHKGTATISRKEVESMSGFETSLEPAAFKVDRATNADQMKSIRKARLQRQVMQDPSLAQKLVAVEATGTYNARGDVIQAVSTSLGDA